MHHRLQFFIALHIPKLQHPIIARRGKQVAVGTKEGVLYGAAKAIEGVKYLSAGNVPDSRGVVATGGGEQFRVGTEVCHVDVVSVTAERAFDFARGHIDKSNLAICAGDEERLTIAGESKRASDTRFDVCSLLE